jgi:two-component system, chemotaxis family, chemotaxis protein CheY
MSTIRALIIDDSSVMRKIVERSLRQAGVNLTQVLEAGNGAEALAVLEQSDVRSRVRERSGKTTG